MTACYQPPPFRPPWHRRGVQGVTYPVMILTFIAALPALLLLCALAWVIT
jgi:hypothetical protein